MKLIIILLLLLVQAYYLLTRPVLTPTPATTISPAPAIHAELVEAPIADFKNRITKKFFGTFVTPQNSPVSPEKFRGFHTGVDVEYGDITAEEQVKNIANGQIIYSGLVSGYGGFVAEQITINSQPFIAIYGHLRPSSLIKNNSKVNAGDQIGVLGTAYSVETDGERRHLHFALLKGTKLDFRGYVQSQSELSLWSDPLTLFP
ncbi:MAG: M23 family metallopeptidase [Candidatus Shapirobacteria bacterium]|nr:M23 family metallopeptidase [Candidatus Shapirobacteria bacterium]